MGIFDVFKSKKKISELVGNDLSFKLSKDFLDSELSTENEFILKPYSGKAFELHLNGKIAMEGEYVKGKQHGKWKSYYDHGQLDIDGSFNMGKMNGKHTFFHKNGILLRETNYKNGNEEGLNIQYYQNGKIEYKEIYNCGWLSSKINYDYDGNILKEFSNEEIILINDELLPKFIAKIKKLKELSIKEDDNKRSILSEIHDKQAEDIINKILCKDEYKAIGYYQNGLLNSHIDHRKNKTKSLKNFMNNAIKDFTNAIQIDEKEYKFFKHRGICYMKRGFNQSETFLMFSDILSASKDLKKGLTIKEDDLGMNYYLGKSLYILDKFEDAIIYLSKFLFIKNKENKTEKTWTIYALNSRARCYIKLKDYNNAIEDITELINIDPNRVEYYVKRCVLYDSLKKHKLAEQDKEIIKSLNPDHDSLKINSKLGREETILNYYYYMNVLSGN